MNNAVSAHDAPSATSPERNRKRSRPSESGDSAAMRMFDSIPDSGISIGLNSLEEIASLNGSIASVSSHNNSSGGRNGNRNSINNPNDASARFSGPGSVPTSPIRRLVYEMDNAVHMHLQENAKVPNFTLSVDRSNSNRPAFGSMPSTPTRSDLDVGTGTGSMAELFLSKESAYRKSLNENYESLGKLLEDVDFRDEPAPLADAIAAELAAAVDAEQAQKEIDAITASIDPTPWSEIKKRYSPKPKAKSKPQQSLQIQAQTSDSRHHPHQSTYYPYGRNEQLPMHKKASPMPSKKNSAASILTTALEMPSADLVGKKDNAAVEPNVSNMAQALATAAAIASTSFGQTTQKQKAQAPVQNGINMKLHPVPIQPQTIQEFVAKTPNLKPPPDFISKKTSMPSPRTSQRHHHRQQQDYIVTQQAAKHQQARESLNDAVSKKSQYGFGRDHKVPSVPPTPQRALAAPRTIAIAKKPEAATAQHPPALSSEAMANVSANTGAAYERKKQRAKDARIKLNESIERLAIAISLAGTQSKQRVGFVDKISKTEARQKTIHNMEECVHTADSAKKWDRPSFVGTAASLIQSLNSQCESLTRELSILQRKLDQYESGAPGSKTAPPSIVNGATGHKRNGVHDEHSRASKRACVEPSSGHQVAPASTSNDGTVSSNVPDEKIIFDGVAKMLDPISLSRCPCVCQAWRDVGCFDADQPWLDCAIRRFGNYNVRQWLDKLEERNLPKKEVYRIMNSENVMPHMPQESGSGGGMMLLGDARMPGRLSGWAFLVERSNGETLRSVKRPPSTKSPSGGGGGPYVSLPVVELRIVLQNVGMGLQPIVIPEQLVAVDISTRRSGGELKEIYWDERLTKVMTNLDGSKYESMAERKSGLGRELCRLNLFEAVVLHVFLHAPGCSTLTKFQQRSNYTKLLVCIDGTTVPLVVPFYRDVPI